MRKVSLVMITLAVLLLSSTFYSPSASAASTQEWIPKADLPESRSGTAVAQVNGKIYVFGGTSNGSATLEGQKTNTTYEYNPSSDKWTRKRDMPSIRSAATASVVNEKIYVIGGYYNDVNNKIIRTNTVDIYDPNSDTWSSAPPMPTARSWASSVTLDNKIYVVGGTDNTGAKSFDVKCFDTATNTWKKMNKLSFAASGVSLNVVDGDIYVSGGALSSIFDVNPYLYRYNDTTDTWTLLQQLKEPKDAAASVVIGSDIYLLGGYDSNRQVTDTVEKYNTITNQSEIVDNLKLTFSRSLGSALAIGSNIYLIGGVNGQVSGTVATVESFELNPTPEPQPEPSGDRAILTVTMTTGLEKEYDLSMEEVNDFLDWYDTKDAGSGPSKYAISKHDNNKGPFSKRTDYVIFNNILTFEINEYTTVTSATYK